MDRHLRVVTELRLRREAAELTRSMLVAHLQLRCEGNAEGLDGRTARDWEDRSHVPCAVYAAALCDYFRVASIAELGLGHGVQAAAHWTWSTQQGKDAEVQRRQVLRASAVGMGAALLPVGPLAALAQKFGGRQRVDAAAVSTSRLIATHLAVAYSTAPGQEAVRAAMAHAHTLLDLLDRATMSPSVRAGLQAVAADAACLVGEGLWHAGRFAEADVWFAEALRLAREAGDPRLEAFALGAHGWTPMCGPAPDPVVALAAFEAAARLRAALPAEGQAWVFAELSLARAAVGDDLESGRLLERARAAAARVRPDDPGWGYWSAHGQLAGWDAARFDDFGGARSLRLGRPAEAAEFIEAARDGTVVPTRRVWLHTDLTRAWVALGDPERACASAHAGLDEADSHGLAFFPHKIRNARAAFPPQWGALAPVVDLDERLALIR